MTADHIIEKIREENTALAADRAAWITTANTWMKRAKEAEAERDALRKALEPIFARADKWKHNSDNARVSVKLGDLRRARSLLAGDNHE